MNGIALLGLLLCVVPSAVQAGEATEFVKERHAAIAADLIREPDGRDLAAFHATRMMDVATIALATLGKYGPGLSPDDFHQFDSLFLQLLGGQRVQILQKVLVGRIEYLPEEEVDGVPAVKMRAYLKGDKEPVAIDYRMERIPTGWKVVDVITDGVSLTSSYRSQFTKIIAQDGFAALLEKVRARIEKDKAAP